MKFLDRLTKWQKEARMKIGYPLLGNSAANFLGKKYFDFITDKIPPEFLNKEISDLGCGDGFATQKIKSLFKAKSIKGYEVNKYLIDKARKRGLEIKRLDLEKEVPKGEMAVVWGVIHHLNNQKEILRKIRFNFNYAVFNEPIKSFWAFLDGGEPLTEPEWKYFFNKILGNCRFLKFKDSLFIFWRK